MSSLFITFMNEKKQEPSKCINRSILYGEYDPTTQKSQILNSSLWGLPRAYMKGMKHVFLDFGPINGPKQPKWAKTAENPHFWPKNETTIKITFNHQKCTRFGLCSWFCPIFWPGGQKWPFLDFFYSKVDFTFWDLQRGITITRNQVWMIRSTFWKSFDPTQPPKKIQLVLGTFVIIKFFKVFSPIWAVLIRYQIRLQKWLCIHMFWHQNQSEWCKTIFFPKLIVAVMLKMVQNGPKKALKWPEIV